MDRDELIKKVVKAINIAELAGVSVILTAEEAVALVDYIQGLEYLVSEYRAAYTEARHEIRNGDYQSEDTQRSKKQAP